MKNLRAEVAQQLQPATRLLSFGVKCLKCRILFLIKRERETGRICEKTCSSVMDGVDIAQTETNACVVATTAADGW